MNFPTKEHWRPVSKLSDITRGLEYLEEHYREWDITSLAVPPLGCGQGQLDWLVVGPTLYRHLKHLDIPVELYAPWGTSKEQLQPEFLDTEKGVDRELVSRAAVRIDPAWIALVPILERVEQERFHWPGRRIKFQKLVYFATQSGILTRLKFQKGEREVALAIRNLAMLDVESSSDLPLREEELIAV
jgi:hypothetical protein